MGDLLILLSFLLFTAFGLTHALLMVASPSRHRRFVYRLRKPFQKVVFDPDSEHAHQGSELSYRLAGLGLATMCGWLAWTALRELLRRYAHAAVSSRRLLPASSIGAHWFAFVPSVVCVAGGIYMWLRPLDVYRWSVRDLPARRRSQLEPKRIRRGMRFLSVCFIAAGLNSLWLALGPFLHR